MKNIQIPGRIRVLFTLLNILIGWHLLYEGVIKLLDPSWTSAAYLTSSIGPLSGIFRGIAENSFLLGIADWVNIVGLTLFGFLLITGIKVRFATIGGALLIFMYYLSQPPFAAMSTGYAIEGHYLIVNKNLIEIIALILIAFLPVSWYYGIGKLLPSHISFSMFKKVNVPKEVNHEPEHTSLDRRAMVKNLISIPVLGGFFFAVAKNHGWKSFEEKHLTDATTSPTIKIEEPVDLSQLKAQVPKGKIGDIEMGRVICGSNLISGFAHSRDLIYVSTFLKRYFNEKKVMDTFWLCEQCGINATAVSARPAQVSFLDQYKKQGGNMKWIAPTYPEVENFRENIDFALEHGADAVMIMGNVGDQWAREGKWELIAETIEYIKSQGVPAGLAGHEITTIKGAEEHQIKTDFYMKTLHSKNYWSWKPEQEKNKMIIDNYAIDNYWDRTPDETIAYMETLNKPWIAFKILAAGAIHPKEGIRYAFENGADFACLGMFDFQIVENANILTDILNDSALNRKREWIA